VQWDSRVYLYRAIDRDGNLVDVFLSERRDRAAAEAFFRSARAVTDSVPARVATDGHDSYPGAIKAELGEDVTHRTNRYLNNHLEQDHRGIKQRTHSICGFKSFMSAERGRVPAPGGATGGATLGQCGSDHASDDCLRAPHDPPTVGSLEIQW
jgi:transposase-like protein